ncbi:Uncharacterised protein [Mycobacteroides abscessus subsp. abscessus]|nr:Uncharacterised protein [Mycobacteroides abscessus subsp. abscessus]
MFTRSAAGPPPFPSPFIAEASLSTVASTRSNPTGVRVRSSGMRSPSLSTGPSVYGGLSATCRSVSTELVKAAAMTFAGTLTSLSTLNLTST